MAYGNTGILGQVAADFDRWVGSNSLNLLASHNPALAIMIDESSQPGFTANFRKGDATGRRWRISAWWSPNSTVDGITRAEQATTTVTPAIRNPLTGLEYYWAHYIGGTNIDYREETANMSPSKIVDVADSLLQQIQTGFYEKIGDHLLDATVDAEDRIMALDYPDNTNTVGGVDTSDSANNLQLNVYKETTVEVLSTVRLSEARANCVYDSVKAGSVPKSGPDACFMRTDVWNKILTDLTQSQRTDVQRLQKGGAEFFEFAGMRCFNTNRLTAGRVLGVNTATIHFRYNTIAPDPVTSVWTPVSGYPAMKERLYNWLLGTGYASLKHNFLLTGKTAS